MATQWFCAENGEKYGPISTAELKRLAATGRILADTMIWKNGMGEWVPAEKIKGLIPVTAPPELPLVVEESSFNFVPEVTERKPKPIDPTLIFNVSAVIGVIILLLAAATVSGIGSFKNSDGHTVSIPGGIIGLIIGVPAFLAAYFAPSIIAFVRKHQNAPAILILNLLGGWTGVVWIGALVWSVTEVRPRIQQHFHNHN